MARYVVTFGLAASLLIIPIAATSALAQPAPPPGPGAPLGPGEPPARREEAIPPPPRGRAPEMIVWERGHWVWRRGRWQWVPGHYVERPRRGAVWVPGHWERGRRVWIEGHWQR